ncbi:hypothetical protein P8452_02798 [Trifolium repens]|nr:hypothetical protein P8452_02798 [Trifolium repens]
MSLIINVLIQSLISNHVISLLQFLHTHPSLTLFFFLHFSTSFNNPYFKSASWFAHKLFEGSSFKSRHPLF